MRTTARAGCSYCDVPGGEAVEPLETQVTNGPSLIALLDRIWEREQLATTGAAATAMTAAY